MLETFQWTQDQWKITLTRLCSCCWWCVNPWKLSWAYLVPRRLSEEPMGSGHLFLDTKENKILPGQRETNDFYTPWHQPAIGVHADISQSPPKWSDSISKTYSAVEHHILSYRQCQSFIQLLISADSHCCSPASVPTGLGIRGSRKTEGRDKEKIK